MCDLTSLLTRRTLASASLILGMLAPTLATDAVAGPGPGHFTSDNVQWISVNPRHTGSSGGRLVGSYFYVTDPRGVYIYDVSNPAAPVLTGSVPVVQAGERAALMQEDPDTNGKVLIMSGVDPTAPSNGNRFLVIDVTNKTAPAVIGSLASDDHTWSCIADCTYAIGRTGGIIDLSTPSSPKTVGNWKTSVPGSGYTHDFTEVRPGRLMSAGQPSIYIDSTNPASPVKLTTIKTTFSSLGYHSAVWPRQGQDKFLVMGTEIAPAGTNNLAGSDCQGDGEIATYDTSAVLAEDLDEQQNPDGVWGPANFVKKDFWEIAGRGTYSDGRAPAHTLYCSHWFDTHPDWNDGGLIAMAHYDFGTRFLKVDSTGDISEVGWFQPVGGYTASAYWITKDIVYVLDYRRGLDIMRFTGA
ncbi:MAG: LVIVD repeat-containing protein [Actinomycetota bacterium]